MKHSKVTFNLDLGDIFSDISIPIKKTAKVLNIILMENGQPYETEKDCKVVFYAKKPNGDVLYNDCIVRDNVIEYQLTTQTIALAGIVECELLVYGEDSSNPIHSPSFTLVNYEPVFDGGEAIESTNEFTALTQAMGTLETLIDQAKDVVGSKSDDYTIHTPNYISSNATPSDIKFGTHVCAVTEFDSTLPESNKEYTVQGTLEVTKAFDGLDCIRMYWHPCRSHNVYSRLPLTDKNWSKWETAQSGSGVAESVVNEKIATAKSELIGGADDLTDADTIHAAKNLARGLVNALEGKVVKTTELNNAINSALLQAKESGAFDGVDGKDGANGLSAYQIWLQQGNTGSEADFLESLQGDAGATGATGANGTSVTITSVTESTADGGENIVTFSNGQTLKVKNGSRGSKGDTGATGATGANGTSVTITSVTESTTDGGENVVAFSNGQTLKVKNGSRGSKGEKGDSYVLTEDDKQEIADTVKAEVPLVKVAEQPTFVNSVDEMIDTSKVYVMPNGNIWAYTKGLVENKVNRYKSDTAQFNVRYNQNTGEMSTTRGFVLVEVDGLDFTGKSEYIVRFSGETLVRHTNLGVYGQVTFFNGSEFSSTKWIYSTANANSIAFTQDDIGYYVDLMDAAPDTNVTKCYFAICLADNTTISAADCDDLFIEFVPLTTYTEDYAWCDTGISYVQYIPTDNDFNNIAEKVNKKINATIYVDGESGDDTKAGSQDSPLKTIQKAIDSGAKTIYCKAGTYNEGINLNNVHGVKIIGQWETYESGKRPKVRIDHSTLLTPSDNGNGLKTVALPVDTYKYVHPLLYQVFVTKTLPPTTGSGITIGYVVSLWNVTDEQVSTHYKLVPVMTLDECRSTEETFFYDGATLYIHSTGSTFRMVSSNKRNKVENCSNVVFEDIAFDYCYSDCLAVNDSNGIIFRNCEFSHSSTLNGLATVNTNGELYNCEAYRNRNDGFNFHDFGETTVYNCIGAYNYDDGISHHDGCTGSIHGGQYHHNGKGGVSSPTYGAVIDIYNAVMHDNQYGIYAVGGTADRQIIVNGCYIHNNTYGIVSPQYELLVIHSTFIDNSTNTSGNVTIIGST